MGKWWNNIRLHFSHFQKFPLKSEVGKWSYIVYHAKLPRIHYIRLFTIGHHSCWEKFSICWYFETHWNFRLTYYFVPRNSIAHFCIFQNWMPINMKFDTFGLLVKMDNGAKGKKAYRGGAKCLFCEITNFSYIQNC